MTESAFSAATYQVRNRATLVGNICNPSPAADLAPPLFVLDARLVIAGPDGERKVPIAEFMTGVTKEGKITALEIKYYWDAGALADYGVNIGRAAAYSGAGPYEVPNCKIDSYVVYTNKVFGTAYRGFGHLELLWGVERNMDILAGEKVIDALDQHLCRCSGYEAILEDARLARKYLKEA